MSFPHIDGHGKPEVPMEAVVREADHPSQAQNVALQPNRVRKLDNLSKAGFFHFVSRIDCLANGLQHLIC